jgi:protein TonB
MYAGRADDRATATLSLDVDLRGWPAQCTQWLIVFGLLGMLIGGAKWWDGRQAVGTDRFVTASTVTVPVPQSGTEAIRTDEPPAASNSPAAAAPLASTSDAPVIVAAATRTGAPVPVPVGDEQRASESAAQTFRVPSVRAPAEVPYPRRIHDVQPQVPSAGAATRGIAVLSVLIDTAGNVAEVEILRSLDPALDAAAIDAARQWRFEPTMRQGRLVAVRGNFTVTFGY